MYSSTEKKSGYFPPLLSNGSISFAPDAEGMLNYTVQDYLEKGIRAFDGIVVRAARRSGQCTGLNARLFPFGKFSFREGSSLSQWSQNLIPEEGAFESSCCYDDGGQILSKGFIHPEMNVYALQKTFTCTGGWKRFSYDVTLVGYHPKISQYMDILYTKRVGDVCCIGFKMYGMEVFRGEIRFFVDRAYEMEQIENGVRILFEAENGETVSFFYMLEDDMDGMDYAAVLVQWEGKIRTAGFSGLLQECQQHFRDFYDLGFVKTADAKLNSIYKTALYGVKCSATPYSIAVGLNNGSWDGRYFAFDEYTSYLGLLGANRLQLAKRVPDYRLNRSFPTAVERASDCHRTEETEDMARFHWESGEIDRRELAPDGTWIDHIFHIPLVGIGAFEYFTYSDDREYLQRCYKMIRACAKFITKHMVYRDGSRLYIGKCTDLERLGASVENPFLTACGAIRLLQCCAKAAEILQTDEAYARECTDTANRLYESLPVENGMYVPHLKCKQKSIAVFGGKFPFSILSDDDEKMKAAWQDFEQNGAAYGNMYPEGTHISPWYACWKATAYARAKDADKAYDALRQAYLSVGVFDEMFEINEENVHFRPWFTTAAGIFLVAVNEMLLQSEGSVITLLPAFPHCVDVCFKLAAKGGVTVEAEIKTGKLERVRVSKDGQDVTHLYELRF